MGVCLRAVCRPDRHAPWHRDPLGPLVSDQVRQTQTSARFAFKAVYLTGLMPYASARSELASALGIDETHCHFEWLDFEQASLAQDICKDIYQKAFADSLCPVLTPEWPSEPDIVPNLRLPDRAVFEPQRWPDEDVALVRHGGLHDFDAVEVASSYHLFMATLPELLTPALGRFQVAMAPVLECPEPRHDTGMLLIAENAWQDLSKALFRYRVREFRARFEDAVPHLWAYED